MSDSGNQSIDNQSQNQNEDSKKLNNEPLKNLQMSQLQSQQQKPQQQSKCIQQSQNLEKQEGQMELQYQQNVAKQLRKQKQDETQNVGINLQTEQTNQNQIQEYLSSTDKQQDHLIVSVNNKIKPIQIEDNTDWKSIKYNVKVNQNFEAQETKQNNQANLFQSVYQEKKQYAQQNRIFDQQQSVKQEFFYSNAKSNKHQVLVQKIFTYEHQQDRVSSNQQIKTVINSQSQQTIIQFDFKSQQNRNQLTLGQKSNNQIQLQSSETNIQIVETASNSSQDKIFEVSKKNKQIKKQVDLNAFYVSNSQNLYPSLSLHSKIQNDDWNQLPIKIKIHSYHNQQFLKMQTQVYQIQVQTKNQNYQIQRRYSDFLFLFQSMITNHLGYILYPFPQKNIESFLKIKLSFGQTSQKYQIIERRIKQLEQFVNYLIFHQDLKNSQQLGIFLVQDQELFEKGKTRIQKYIEQYNQLENISNANIQNLITGGFSYVKSWIKKQDSQSQKIINHLKIITKQDAQFSLYSQIVDQQILNYQKMLQMATNLSSTEKSLSEFHDVETEVDQLLKLCSKLVSGRQYCRYFNQWLSNQIIEQINFVLRSLYQLHGQLIKRSELVELAFIAQKSNQTTKKSKLKRRIQRFQTNFQTGFSSFIENCKKQYKQKIDSFVKMWEEHRLRMIKIWI